MQLDWMVACKLKCATSRPTSNSNHLSSTPHLPLRRISSGLILNAKKMKSLQLLILWYSTHSSQEIAVNEPWREIVRRRDSETSLATGDINTPLLWKLWNGVVILFKIWQVRDLLMHRFCWLLSLFKGQSSPGVCCAVFRSSVQVSEILAIGTVGD